MSSVSTCVYSNTSDKESNIPPLVGIVGILASLSRPNVIPWANIKGILSYLTKK
jgi:hypothetical protein